MREEAREERGEPAGDTEGEAEAEAEAEEVGVSGSMAAPQGPVVTGAATEMPPWCHEGGHMEGVKSKKKGWE